MPDNEKVVIDVELELQKARSDLASQREDFGNVKNDIQSIKQDTQNSGAFGLAGTMDEEQARVTTVIDSLTSKMEHMSHLGSNVSEAMLNSLRNGIKDLSAQRDLLKDGGNFSVNIAHQMFGDMSKEIQNELARQTPAIANAIRGMFNSGQLTGNIQQMAASMFSNLFISNLNQSIKQMSGGEGVLQKYIAAMMPYVIGTGNTQAFQRMRYSGQDLVRSSMSVRSLIPEPFRDSYLKGSFTSNIRHGNNNMLASGGVLALRNQLESNAIANAIAERTGQMKLDNAGYGQLRSSITTAEYNRFAKEQYNDLVTRATGHGGAKIDFYGTNLSPRDTNRLIGRMLGGTTGESLKALEELARIGGIKENWQPTAANLSQSLRLSRMPQRHLEQYEIKKFALGDILNNDLTRAKTVMLNQSVATNELGLRGKNNQSTDMIIEIDASKFDKDDPNMAKRVTDLYRNGYTINGRHYEAVATHGTGEDTVIRMIDANAKRQISKRYAGFAKQYGLKGDFWNLFAENGRAWSLSDLSRMYDAQNKMWTGAADVTNEAAFKNANFAFLDLTKLSKESKQKFADGIGWITKSLFPYSGMQSRFAQAGKGVLQSIDTNDIGAWAEAMSGPEGKKGKFYQELLKATGLSSLDNIQGLIEETQIKNMFAYKGMSTDQRNRALTALMRTFRPTLMHSTEDATTYADALGAQAMQFINWNATSDSRAFSREHTQALIERIRMLNTPTGRREMLEQNTGMFGEKYRAGAIDENDPAAYALANNEIRRLMQATASGAFVDLTGKSIQNLQLNRTLHQAMYGRYGHSSGEEIRKDLLANSMISSDKKLTEYVKGLSEDQLRGIFALDQGSAVNFGNMNEDKFTGVVSPGGIGEVVRLTNYAAIAAPIYKALGYSTEGLLLNDKDMETLSGRDWDGDKIKAVYGRLGELYWDQVSNLRKRISEQSISDIEKTPTRRGSKFYDTPEEQMEFLARSIAVSRLMGVGDSGAAKAASDLDDVNSLIAAKQFSIFYQYATDSLKNGETPEMNDKMKTINFRPRDFRRLTKIYPGLTDVSGLSDESDIYNDTQSGFKINLESLRRQKLHRVDVRSAKRAGTVEAASLAGAFAAVGLDYGSADAVLRAQEHLYETEEKDIIPEELVQARKLRSAMNKIKIYDAAGQHGALSMRDEAFITEMQKDAQANITAYAQKHLNDKPLFDNEGNQITEVNKYINRLQKQFSVDVAQNLLHGNGLRAETLRSLGYTEETAPYMFASLFSPNTTVDMTQKQVEDVRKALEQAKREAVVSEFNRQTRSGQGRDAMIARGRGVTAIEPWMVAENGTALTLSGLTVTDASGKVVKDDYVAELRTNAERRAAREAEEIRRQNNPNVPQTAAEARGSFAHKALELYYGNDQKYAGKSAAQIMLDLFGGDDSSVKVLKDAGISLENGVFKGDSREVGILNNYLNTLGLITTKFDKGQGSYVPEFSAEYSGKDFQDAIAALNLNPNDNKNKTWIKTDLLRYNKDGTIDVFDYKPDLRQAGESLFQTISYIGMIDKIAEEAYKSGDANTLAKFGKFGTFENGQYKSNFNKLYGIDLSTGQSVEMDTHGREEDLRNVYKRFLAGASDKAEAANMGFEPGLEIYRQKLLSEMQANDRAALDIEATDKLAAQILKDNRESGKQFELNPVMATKFQQDQEALRSISSALFKKEMRLTNQPEAVYSEYGGMQRQLDKMLPQNTISILKAQAMESNDEISKEYYDTLQRERREAEEKINKLSVIDAQGGFENTRERVGAIINGTQRSAAASKIFALHNAVRQSESDLEFIRQNNFKEDKWTSEDAEKAYKTGEEALRALKATESAGIKRILEEDKMKDDNTLSRLTKDFTANDPYAKIEEQFKQREQNIADFIEQKKRDVETFTKDMKQAESAGNKDEANQYKKRIGEQTQAQQAAEDYLKSGDLNRQKEIDRQRLKFQQEMNGEKAVLQSENAAISAGRWRYQNMQVGATAWERNIINSRMRAEEAGQQYKQYEIQYKYALQKQTEAESAYNQNTTIENHDAFVRASEEVNNYKKAMEEAAAAQQAFGAGGGVVKGTLDTITNGLTRLTAQFGRRLFHKALQEAKQFTVQFSTQMSTIQSITMKSDEEMTDVRRNTIEKAKSLHTSVANVADVEASLYRQGQSDAEVSERTDAIVKFATVTGVKVTAATKYLTSAIQNGLVGSVQEAMDVLVALGDSAATTAEEISKGMQKSAAAAKNAGVSYEELTSMLTIITSKTQLGGATAGTAQQTIFSRMTRVTNSGSVTDASGETTTINDVEKALQGAGINLRNPGNPREIRNVFEVLRDLSKVWNELDDLRKGNISYYMAGGRQVNMFQTLMEGMAENGGKDQDEYLGLAEGSKGVTQSKYEIAIDNIQTKLTDLKTTFDSVIENIVSGGAVGGVLDFANNVVSGLDVISEKLGGIPAQLAAISVAQAAVAVKALVVSAVTNGIKAGSILGMTGLGTAAAPIVGAVAAAGTLAAGMSLLYSEGVLSSDQQANTPNALREQQKQQRSNYANMLSSQAEKQQKAVDNANRQLNRYKEEQKETLTESQVRDQKVSLADLVTTFPDLGDSVVSASSAQESWVEVLNNAENSVSDFKKTVNDIVEQEKFTNAQDAFEDMYKSWDRDRVGLDSYNKYIERVNLSNTPNGIEINTPGLQLRKRQRYVQELADIYGEDVLTNYFNVYGGNYFTSNQDKLTYDDFYKKFVTNGTGNDLGNIEDYFRWHDFVTDFIESNDETLRNLNAIQRDKNINTYEQKFNTLFKSGGLMYDVQRGRGIDDANKIAAFGNILWNKSFSGYDIGDYDTMQQAGSVLREEVDKLYKQYVDTPSVLESVSFTRNDIEVTKQAGQTWQDVWDSASEEVRQAILEEIEALSESTNEAVDTAVEEIIEDTEQPLVETDEAFKQGIDKLKTRGRMRAEGPLVTDFSFQSGEKWWKNLSDEDLIAKLVGTWDFGMGPVERTEDMLREMSRERLELLAKSYDKKIEAQPAAATEAQTAQTHGITQEQYDRVLAKLKSGEPQGDIDKQILKQYVPPNPELQTLAGLNDTLIVSNGNVVFNQNRKTEEEIAAEEAYNNAVFETAASAAKRKDLLQHRMLDLASDDWTAGNERFAQDVGEMRKAIAVAVAEDTGINDKTATQLSLMASTNAELPFYNMNPAEVKTSVNRGRAKFMTQFFEDNLDTVAKIVQQVDSANEEQLNAVIEDYQAEARVVEESIEPRVLEVMKERVTLNADQLRRQTEEAARAQQVAVSEGTDFTSILYAMSDVTKAAYKSFADNVHKVIEQGQPEIEKDVAETVAEEVAPAVTESGLARPTEEGFAQLNTIKGTLPNAGQTAMSAYEAVLSSMTAKDRGYRDEWRALYGYLLTSDYSGGNTIHSQMDNIGNVDNFKNFSIFQKNDHTLAQLMSDIDNGLKDRSELFSYVAEKVFGKDFDEFVRNLKDSYKNIEKSKVKAQRAIEGRATYEEYKEIADAMMVDVEDINNEQIQRYEESLSIAERQNEFNARSTVGGVMSQWLEQRVAAGEELGDFDSVWEDYLSSITDINAKNQQIAYMRQLQSSGMQFGLEAQRDENDKIVGYKITSSYTAPEALEQQSVFTPEEIRAAARRVLAGNFSDLGSNENLAQAVSQRYGDLTALKGLTEEQLNTLYGQTLQRDIEVQFKTEGIQEQEQAGRIVNGIASAVEQIGKGNVLESFKGVQAIRSMATEELDAYAAYQRIASNGGIGTQKDWATVGSYYGIDTTPYTRGQRNIGELGGVVADWHDVMVNSGNTIARAELERAYAAYFEGIGQQSGNISELSTDHLTKWYAQRYGQDALSKYMTGFERDENGNWIIKATPTGTLTYADWEESRRSVVDEERLRQEQATSLYGMLSGASSFSIANNILRHLSGNGSKDMRAYISNLLESGALDNIESLDDLLALVYSQSSMGQYSSYYSGFKYADAAPYITAQLEGNRNTLNTLAGNKEMSNYLRSIVGDWDVLSAEGYTLTEADRARLLTTSRVQAAEEIEKATPALEGLKDIVTSLVGATSDTRRQDLLRSSFGGSISEYVNAMRNINDSETVASYLGVDQNIVRGWDTDKRKEEIENRAKDWQDTLKEAVKIMFTGIDTEAYADWTSLTSAIEAGGDQINASWLKVITDFFALMGQSVEDFYNNGTLNTNGTFDQFAKAGEDYEKQLAARGARSAIASAANSAKSFEEFSAAVEAMRYTGEYDTNGKPVTTAAWNEFEKMYPSLSDDYKRALAGEMDWKTAQALFTNLDETAQAMTLDNVAERMIRQINEAFGENAFAEMSAGTYAAPEGFDLYAALEGNLDMRDYIASTEEGKHMLETFGQGTEEANNATKRFAATVKTQAMTAMRQYGDRTEEVANYYRALARGGKDAKSVVDSLYTAINKGQQNKFWIDKWLGGDRSDETAKAIAGILGKGFDADTLKRNGYDESIIESMLKAEESEDVNAIQSAVDSWASMLSEQLTAHTNEIDGDQLNIKLGGTVDGSSLTALVGEVSGMVDGTLSEIAAILEAAGLTGLLTIDEDDQGNITVSFNVDGLTGSGGYKGGGGGGGGGGKSAAQEFLEKLKREQATLDHEIKMIQSQQEKYEIAGEYGNQNAMYFVEIEARKRLASEYDEMLPRILAEMDKVEKNSDDWYSLADAYKETEEKSESNQRAMEKLNKTIDENNKKIRQMRLTLEQYLAARYEEDEQIRRDQLGGEVDLQNRILEVIRQRHRDEWDQIDKDLQKKREALQEEMNMIDERLRRRTEAEDDAEKREELAEMRRQAALIAADPTRSKDYNELMEKIREGEREESRKTAERNAEYQKKMLEQESESLDKASQEGAERLDNLLKDANNFRTQINNIMSAGYDDIVNFFASESEEYANMLSSAQQQFIDSLNDTYKQWQHIKDTWWDEIYQFLDVEGGREAYIERGRQSDEYRFASPEQQAALDIERGEEWDNWVNANKTGATYSHSEPWGHELYDTARDIAGDNAAVKAALQDTNKDVKAILEKLPEDMSLDEAMLLQTWYLTNYKDKNNPDVKLAEEQLNASFQDLERRFENGEIAFMPTRTPIAQPKENTVKQASEPLQKKLYNGVKELFGFDEGGLVNFTGPAMVHGSALRPEAFLDAEDTALMRAMLDSMSRVRIRTLASFIDPAKFGGNTQTIGDVNITITEAKFEDDADIEAVAARVGEVFVQQLNQQGFTTGKFAL